MSARGVVVLLLNIGGGYRYQLFCFIIFIVPGICFPRFPGEAHGWRISKQWIVLKSVVTEH